MIMDVSYKKLFKLLIDRGLRKGQFAELVGISPATLAKLSRNEKVSLDVLIKICRALNCRFEDIIEVVPEEK